MKAKLFFLFILLFSLLYIPKQYKAYADTPLPDLSATVTDTYGVHLPSDATAVQATTTQNGYTYWQSNIGNDGTTSVSNAVMSEMSGYDATLFEGITSSFPLTYTTSSITPGDNFTSDWLYPNDIVDEHTVPSRYQTAVSFTEGYDSTRTVSPALIPPGGTQQTVTITITPRDTQYAPPGNNFYIEFYPLDGSASGVTLISKTDPINLDQGEQITGSSDQQRLWDWTLTGAKLNKTYTFTAVINVPNQGNVSYEFRPTVRIGGSWYTPLQETPGSSITIVDPTLDGSVLGSGQVTFSVGDSNHLWSSAIHNTREVLYEGTQIPDFTAPTLNLPNTIITNATSADGAIVSYDVTATDPDNGPFMLPISCSPASGSTFPIGTTTVNCTVHDPAGNTTTGSFQVVVVINAPTSKDQCKHDGWKNYSYPLFKNQGDCVSYVATHGKNSPAGSSD